MNNLAITDELMTVYWNVILIVYLTNNLVVVYYIDNVIFYGVTCMWFIKMIFDNTCFCATVSMPDLC